MNTPMKTKGALSALLQDNSWSGTRSSSEKLTSLLARNNTLVQELMSARQQAHQRKREIAALRLELLLRKDGNKSSQSSPEGSPNCKRVERTLAEKATQTERRALSPLKENAPVSVNEKQEPFMLRDFSPVRTPVRGSLASPVPTKSPLPRPSRFPRGGRRKMFRGTDSLQFLSRSITSITEARADDEMEF